MYAIRSYYVVSCALQGCIAWEIRDELRSVNASLADVQDQLATTNELVERVEERLDQKLQATSISSISSPGRMLV